jgi:UDP-2,4-diacetamido-2,4,6-trideoxy-beta-L-altropyranose hydrolase
MTGPHVVIRADSSSQMGSGHVMRCLTLASELRRRGCSVVFVTRQHQGHCISRIEEAGFAVQRLNPPSAPPFPGSHHREWLGVPVETDVEETLAVLRGRRADWLVVDHYGLDAAWHRAVRACAERLLVIDDLADRPIDADLLLDQSTPASVPDAYANLIATHVPRLLGPRFAMLQPVYAMLRRTLPPRDGSVRRLLVFFGAHDPTASALRVLGVLAEEEFSQLAVDIVPGGNHEQIKAIRERAREHYHWTVHDALPGLAGLMARADLSIGAGGTTTWERACLGLPTLVAAIAENQVSIAKRLAGENAIAFMGDGSQLSNDQWRVGMRDLIRSSDRLRELEMNSRQLADGHGAGRVAFSMSPGTPSHLLLRRATSSDETLLLEWANEARQFAFNKERISPERHHEWFSARLSDAQCAILIAEDEFGLPLGQVRFDAVVDDRAHIDISVDAIARGRGIGLRMISDALQRWRCARPDSTAVAEVLTDNVASCALFLRSGFVEVAAERGGTRLFVMRPSAVSMKENIEVSI